MKVDGIFTVRNAEVVGYPYVESILSVLPLVDEFHINDGGSDDGTLETLQRLDEEFQKTTLHKIPDYESENWEAIDEQLEEMMDCSNADWFIESQADEIWPLRARQAVPEMLEMCERNGFNSIRQMRVGFTDDWRPLEYRYWTVRIVKSVEGLKSKFGGDSFCTPDDESGAYEFSTHNVLPEWHSDLEIIHIHNKGDKLEHRKRHATHLATESNPRKDSYEKLL